VLTVLLVDDDDLVRAVAATIIAELGYAVIEAVDAEAALRILRSAQKVDLLMTDLAMPVMGGMELALIAQSMKPDLPVLYTSAYFKDAEGHPGLRFGRFLQKPWRLGELQTVLDDLLRSKTRDANSD
jgi:CheY-like chemotaxis protein